MTEEKWEPKVVAFVCNWCTYTGADLAGTSRLKYPANMKMIRVMCSGGIDPVFIIKAFERGADGVLISGCHPGDCHYNAGNFHARRRWTMFHQLLEYLGIDKNRLQFSWVSASEGKKFVDVVSKVVNDVRELGPFKGYKELNSEFTAVVNGLKQEVNKAEAVNG
ncbi:MAG: hydrogenase iron-sulfur subunit [Ignavibacteriae bacterium]|jgi:coenzyme F420-reducing hydrogenase delta subunit|nr:hydrogenase iron-sulfur subunit [Ignavibacteriota bacterium]